MHITGILSIKKYEDVNAAVFVTPSVLCLYLRYSAEEIEEKVSSFRLMLQEKQEPPPAAEKLA